VALSTHNSNTSYFAWIDSRYWFKFAMHCCTSLSCPWLIFQNRGPQTGISFVPWAGTSVVKRGNETPCGKLEISV
jgi:hypothetical protein